MQTCTYLSCAAAVVSQPVSLVRQRGHHRAALKPRTSSAEFVGVDGCVPGVLLGTAILWVWVGFAEKGWQRQISSGLNQGTTKTLVRRGPGLRVGPRGGGGGGREREEAGTGVVLDGVW